MASSSAGDVPSDDPVRELLRRDAIKLWLPPHSSEDGSGSIPEETINKYAAELGWPAADVAASMERLRVHAVNKLRANMRWKEEGIAQLTVSVVDPDAAGINNNENQRLTMETSLMLTGSQFQSKIASMLALKKDLIRIIAAGSLLNEHRFIRDQGITHHSEILCIKLTSQEAAMETEREVYETIERTKKAAQQMSQRGEDYESDYALQLTNQKGETINIPAGEKKALTIALSLHEKGRSQIKRKDWARALLFLLEADVEFRQCRSDLLEAADNYAIVCLDIVWCYLCLKSLTNLPDAEVRLKTCEQIFNRCYGPNLERLGKVKKNTENEKSLFIRLWLLKGVCAYHSVDRRRDALHWILKAEEGIRELTVDDDKLMKLMEMGYSAPESRLGLRAARGNLDRAVNSILEKREEDLAKRKAERKKILANRLAKTLGATKNGNVINTESMDLLKSMGFNQNAVIEALKSSDNIVDKALDILSSMESARLQVPDELIVQLTSMGFSVDQSRQALEKSGGSLEKALDVLAVHGHAKAGVSTGSSVSTENGSTSSSAGPDEWTEEEEKVWKELGQDIDAPEDYLDNTFEEELQLIEQYKGYTVMVVDG